MIIVLVFSIFLCYYLKKYMKTIKTTKEILKYSLFHAMIFSIFCTIISIIFDSIPNKSITIDYSSALKNIRTTFIIWFFIVLAIEITKRHLLKKDKGYSKEILDIKSKYTDSEIIKRNEKDNDILSAIFLIGIIGGWLFYRFVGFDANDMLPFVVGFSFAVFGPILYLKYRYYKYGITIREFMLYMEIGKGGIPIVVQKLLIFCYIAVSVFAIIAFILSYF